MKSTQTVLVMHGACGGRDIAKYIWDVGPKKCGVVKVSPKRYDDLDYAYQISSHVVIAGGGDISPHLYGQENTYSRSISQKRDLGEMRVLDWAHRDKKPVLGICRGMQMMAVWAGAEMHQSIIHAGLTTHTHITGNHKAYLEPNGRLVKILPYDSMIEVNSRHHQCVDESTLFMAGVETEAYSHDGLVEAISFPDLPWIGVQWHPESMFNSDNSKALFANLLSS